MMKTLRQRARVTQGELAQAIGRTASTVSKWDQGLSFPQLSPSGLKALMNSLECSLDELIQAEEEWMKGKEAKADDHSGDTH